MELVEHQPSIGTEQPEQKSRRAFSSHGFIAEKEAVRNENQAAVPHGALDDDRLLVHGIESLPVSIQDLKPEPAADRYAAGEVLGRFLEAGRPDWTFLTA